MEKSFMDRIKEQEYENGVLDAIALMEEELHGFVAGLDNEMLKQVKARVCARLLNH
jgi:hypothetical protein